MDSREQSEPRWPQATKALRAEIERVSRLASTRREVATHCPVHDVPCAVGCSEPCADSPLMARWRAASKIHQQEINGLSFGDPKDREIARLRALLDGNNRAAATEITRLRTENERLNGLVRQAFNAIDNPIVSGAPQHFMRYPCDVCGGEVSNAGFARKSHERGKVHQAALARPKNS